MLRPHGAESMEQSVRANRTDKMWCDDFDMDLPKIFPEFHEIITSVKDVKLLTRGGVTNGKLNHPSVWNGSTTMLAFFRLWKEDLDPEDINGPQPLGFVTHEKPVVCTFEEALRDCWPHSYGIFVVKDWSAGDYEQVWDSFRLTNTFMEIMYDLRGWKRVDSKRLGKLKDRVRDSLIEAVAKIAALRQ